MWEALISKTADGVGESALADRASEGVGGGVLIVVTWIG